MVQILAPITTVAPEGSRAPAHDTRYAHVWKRYLTWRETFISNVLILSSCYNYPVVTSDIRFDREF